MEDIEIIFVCRRCFHETLQEAGKEVCHMATEHSMLCPERPQENSDHDHDAWDRECED